MAPTQAAPRPSPSRVDELLVELLRSHGPAKGYDVPEVLSRWQTEERALADFLLELGALTRLGVAKVSTVARGLLQLDDLSAETFDTCALTWARLGTSRSEPSVAADQPPLPALPAEGQTLGRVVLGPRLGAGGTSAVYGGTHPTLGVPVVVKVLQPALARTSSEHRDRFFVEARIGAVLNDPAFVRVFDADEQGGLAYIVMEHVEGIDLHEKLGRRPLPATKACELICRLAEILALAHDRGVVHRDVKPHNFFVGHDGSIKLGDFGLARQVGQAPLTGGQPASGTPCYVAPEQILDFDGVDHRADQYSLGVIFFELLTGERPFVGSSVIDIIDRHLHAPVPLERLPAGTPRVVRRVLSRMLAKDPMARYPDCRSIVGALTGADPAPRPGSTSIFLAGLRRMLSATPEGEAITIKLPSNQRR